jgi:predicted metal-binding protein
LRFWENPLFRNTPSALNRQKEKRVRTKQQLEQLALEAKGLGATASAVVKSKEILVSESLADMCNGEYTCPYYGLAANCSPHVGGPAAFRRWQEESEYAITVKIELPRSVMFSDERKGVMQLLHQIVAAVEEKAIQIGFDRSKAFAGGSCKNLFCADEEQCRILAGTGTCRNPEAARPSLSGFGVDVAQLMISSGWSGAKADKPDGSGDDDMSWAAGLILIA